MLSANFKPKRTAAASRGFLATARLSCSNGGTSGFVGRRRALEIQHGVQITGSSSNYAGFTDTRHSKNT